MTVAPELLLMAAVVAEKAAEVAAAAIVTAAGTVRMVLLFERVMTAPPLGATWDRVTVQVLDEFGPRLAGVQTREETRLAGIRLIAVLAALPP